MSEVYDIECLYNCFTYTGYERNTDTWYQFVIHNSRNDIDKLLNHLLRNKKLIMIGYNNDNFDYPVLHHLINHSNEYLHMTGELAARELYKKAQDIISMDFSTVADKNKHIRQLDLASINGYNNLARFTSLKDLEVAMCLELVEDMPISHDSYVHADDIQIILDYNKHDVYATNLFLDLTLGRSDNPLFKGKDKIKLRKELSLEFGMNVTNLPDINIGEQLLLHTYANIVGINKFDLKKINTQREFVDLKECIPYWCSFKTPEFNKLLTLIKNKRLMTSEGVKDSFSESIIFHGAKFDYGIGGCHQCIKPGVYKEDDKHMILDLDVASLYPSLVKSLQFYPQHLGKQYIDIYTSFIDKRLEEKTKPKNERNDVKIEGLKLMLNAVYGKSGERKSFLYDKLYQLKTTIAGQLFISMWCEKMVEASPSLKFLQVNTDGVSILVLREDYDKIVDVNNKLTELTGLIIEYAEYKQMVIRDVNNYLSEYTNGAVKLKGCFEIDKEFHKDTSMRIVPIALREYFINGIPIEQTIKNHKNIYDFCLRLKLNSSSKAYIRTYKNDQLNKDYLTKTTRYFISRKGGSLIKKFNSGKESGVNVGFGVIPFNKYYNSEDYHIDYQFYMREAYKISDIVDNKQLTLF